jgi:hypothetical protein
LALTRTYLRPRRRCALCGRLRRDADGRLSDSKTIYQGRLSIGSYPTPTMAL